VRWPAQIWLAAAAVALVGFVGACGGGTRHRREDAGTSDTGAGIGDAVAEVGDAVAEVGDAAPEVMVPAGPLTRQGGFSPGLGNLCGLAYDHVADVVWIYPCGGTDLRGYSPGGVDSFTVDAPGEDADDVDIDVAPAALTLGTVRLAPGTLLFANGETDTVDIHMIDQAALTPLGTLATQFGNSHVVGAAFHRDRSTMFAVQDRVPGGTTGNTIGEIDPITGAATHTFSVQPSFSVNYGDLDVCQTTGRLFVVSDSADAIAEFTPEGTFVQAHPLPATVSGPSGIGIDDGTPGEAWVSTRNGDVVRLGGFPCP
jgi:hypothetical protein